MDKVLETILKSEVLSDESKKDIAEGIKSYLADLAEQNARAALSVADRVALLQAGRVVRTGTPQDFSDDAALLSEFL